MPSTVPNRKKTSPHRRLDDVTLQLPRKLVEPLGELLQELALSKRKEREDKKPKSRWEKFWTWWKDYGAGVVTIVTIISALVGGLWTLNQYIIQEREKVAQQERQAILERQALIAQFASDLSDESKRNASAYAYALLAGEDAVPLLTSEFLSAAKFDSDQSYQDALVRSLIQVGDSALSPMLDINRQAFRRGRDEDKKIISATQPFFYHYFANKKTSLIDSEKLLSGIKLENQPLAYMDLQGIDFSGTTIVSSDLCLTKISGGTLNSISFQSSNLGGTSFANSHIQGMSIDDKTTAVETHFDNTVINRSDFQGGELPKTTWKNSEIIDSYFDVSNLQGAEFDNAKIDSTGDLPRKM